MMTYGTLNQKTYKMNLILKINQIISNDEDSMKYRITITQGAELINTEEELLLHLKDSIVYQKGIIAVSRMSSGVWELTSNK
jgi:hypothetical protein